MKDLEFNRYSWLDYAAIDWQRIARAQEFYSKKGYTYVETPWAVPSSIAQMTLPQGARPIALTTANNDGILVGSAEQGFLELFYTLGRMHYNRHNPLFSISPCFRGEAEVLPGVTQLAFMKVELFCATNVPGVMDMLRADAEQFMTIEGAQLDRKQTEEGIDLMCGNYEVGSFGRRKVNSPDFELHWVYGTGLAEPRFSAAIEAQKQIRKTFL